jgi:hypothetical protein
MRADAIPQAFGPVARSHVLTVETLSMLIPTGANTALEIGIFLTAFMAVLLRPGSVRMRVFDPAEFADRLNAAAATLRYRRVEKSEASLVHDGTERHELTPVSAGFDPSPQF